MMARGRRRGADQIEEDRALVRRLLAGDEDAFTQFFEDSFQGLYRFALRRLDYDEELAQEMAQGALVKAIDKLDSYRGDAALFTWLCSFCRFEISAHFRKGGRDAEEVELVEEVPEVRAALDALAAGELGPEDELRRKELVRLVHLALDHLPPKYGRALEWKYLEGLSVIEIAERLGLTPKAAESVLTRARTAFRGGFEALTKGLGGEGFRGLRLVGAGRNG
jgi:RNA polymerase sigma-70 factor (ECF subfamily)